MKRDAIREARLALYPAEGELPYGALAKIARATGASAEYVHKVLTSPPPPEPTPMPEVFWAQVDKSGGAEACWPWQGRLNGSGYGSFSRKGYGKSAHRVACFLDGRDPGPLSVLHSCDNRRCCNPAHLFLGTQKDNAADMNAKGRGNNAAKRHLGMAHGMAKLTDDQVREIRALRDGVVVERGADGRMHTNRPTIVELARRYGVTHTLISQIATRRIWKHV